MDKKVLFGLLGEKLDHSASPSIFNHYFQRLNLNCRYNPYPVSPESLLEFIEKVKSFPIVGLNVTIPYKEEIIPHLDEVDQEAMKIGSINVVHNVKGKLKGYNTDFLGFRRVLLEHLTLKIKTAVVLGAGGAARSVIYSLHVSGAEKIAFFSRKRSKLERILDNFSFISDLNGYLWQDKRIKQKARKADLIVNATPVGMFPLEDDSPLDINFSVKKDLIAFDLIYKPAQTKFLAEASKRGIVTENGLRMLIYQALESCKIWKNFQVDEQFFINTSEEVLHASLFERR
jgi:shikimate dehydrogenase